MPHHWKPVEPGNPHVDIKALEETYRDRLMYVGFDGTLCWALIRAGQEDEEGFRPDDPAGNECERRYLEDKYVGWDDAAQAQ